VKPHKDPKPKPVPEKPVKNPDPNLPKKEAAAKGGKKDPLDDKAKDIFAKEQGHWAEIWRNANDPNYKEQPSKNKAKYSV
jgi:hypothetical protein